MKTTRIGMFWTDKRLIRSDAHRDNSTQRLYCAARKHNCFLAIYTKQKDDSQCGKCKDKTYEKFADL